MNWRSVTVAGRPYGGEKLIFICGPCVIESATHCQQIAGFLAETAGNLGLQMIFKASYDKANRTSMSSYRGPGLESGLEILSEVKSRTGLPILTDVHEASHVEPAARVADVLQIPAFLCRQTDLIAAAAASGRAVNIKKGQFLSPWDIRHAVFKVHSCGNKNVMLTERGSSFGYNNLVVDFRGVPIMQEMGHPVILDVTHSLQLPGAAGDASGGMSQYIPHLARAGVAAGVDGLFFEVHDNPGAALSDGANALRSDDLRPLLESLVEIRSVVNRFSLEA